MNNADELKNLAKYYRDILAAISTQTGKHFINFRKVLPYGLTADLGLFVSDIAELISGEIISFHIDRVSSPTVSKIIQKSIDIEEKEESPDQYNLFQTDEITIDEQERNKTSAIIIAIYRKQQFDPFNREIVIGYPIVSGVIGKKKICAPLFYNKVLMDFDPQKNHVILTKEIELPSLNFQLIKHVVESDEDVEIIRQQVLPDLYRDEFDLDVIKKIIENLSQLVPALAGLIYKNDKYSMNKTIEVSDHPGIRVVNASIIINAQRTNAHLLDDLIRLAQIDQLKDDTVINTILAEPIDRNIIDDMEDPAISEKKAPLLFPFQSNKMQRLTAVKAENSSLFVIQGPPGTGKSQTIVNLACHLIAQGKTVLVSSHQNKALEVITKNMPQNIEYLVMSLLKGEKESIKELANKIDGFQSYVSNVDINDYSNRIKNFTQELRNLDQQIKKLHVRFSELKNIERDKHPHYHKYHEIRDYDIIDPSDNIADGMDSIIAHALSEYLSLIKKFKHHESYQNVEKILSSYDRNFIEDCGDYLLIKCKTCSKKNRIYKTKLKLDYKCGHCKSIINISFHEIDDAIKNVLQFINAYDRIKKVVLSEDITVAFCKRLLGKNIKPEDIADYLNNIADWIKVFGADLINTLKLLSEYSKIEVDFDSLRKNFTQFESVINEIEKKLEKLTDWLQVLREYILDDDLPPNPDTNTLYNINLHLIELCNAANSWLKWHFSLKARASRKALNSYFHCTVTYRVRNDQIDKIRKWHDHWKLRHQVISNLNWLNEMDIPTEHVDISSPIGKFYKNTNVAAYYIRLIKAIQALSSIRPNLNEQFVNEQIDNCFKCREILAFSEHLIRAVEYFRLRSDLKAHKKNWHFGYLCDNLFSKVAEVIDSLTPDPSADKIVERVKSVIPYFYDFKRLITLETGDLRSLPKSSANIKKLIFSGQEISALSNPALIVESFRLSGFIRRDMLENPDDINEIAIKISRSKTESRNLILKILDAIRKKSLKEAESNPKTRFQIRKLREVLKRKKKTYSFVQLKEQIEYKRLLSFFPCWVMSIEDVARIFPLQEGLFDYLIVDEASQCNQATALHLAYRAQRMIIVGDSKQMKNPNIQFLSDQVVRLNLTKHGLDNHPKAVFFHGRKSLLDLADGCSDTSSISLNEHFRCEPPLIAFSNDKFYDGRLKILTPFRRRRFSPCMDVRMTSGAYDDPDDTKQNEVEAEAVIAELKRMIDNGELEGDEKGKKLSVGLLSPFRHQATLLQSKMYEAFENDPLKIKEYDIIASTVDGFQGDERDVILYSFRYAQNSKPGSIIALQRESDEHSLGRLNVAFSRPRRKAVCFISTPIDKFPKGLFRDYLNHAANENSRPYRRFGNPNEKEKCQSDFERHVFDDLAKEGLEIYSQVPCAGFFIDFVVIDNEGRRIALECDGEFHYEDGELREEDYQRQDIIERYGWFVFRIPARKYYNNPQKTIKDLLEILKLQKPDEEIDSSNGYANQYKESSEKSDDQETDSKEILESKPEIKPEREDTIEDKIIEILSEEGPLATWLIAQKIKLSRSETNHILQAMNDKEWILPINEKGVMMWKEIL